MNFQAYTLTNHPEWACIHARAPNSENRVPIHLCCVIDVSGSMEDENKLSNVKSSLHFLLDFLGPQDRISIITFTDVARTIVKQISITALEKENIRTRLTLIQPDSNTNMSAGLIEASGSLLNNTTEYKQGILLLTDGIANAGLTLVTQFVDLVRGILNMSSGTSISCVGYGTDHNAGLLQQISSVGGGSYYVVNNLENVAVVFGDVIGGLVSCFAQQVRVLLPIGTKIKTRYSTSTNNDGIEVMIGDLVSGGEGVILARLGVGNTVTLNAYDLTLHSAIQLETHVTLQTGGTLETDGEAHYLRFEVLQLLEESRRIIQERQSTQVVSAHIGRINNMIAHITLYSQTHPHSLWETLLEELNNCKHSMENRNNHTHETVQILSQHGAYLGLMRGLAATATLSAEDIATPVSATLSRGFSNAVQRNISSQLHSIISPARRTAAVTTLEDDPYDANDILTEVAMNPELPIPSTQLRRQTAAPLSPKLNIASQVTDMLDLD